MVAALGGLPAIDQVKEDVETRGWKHVERFILDELEGPAAEGLRKDLLQTINEGALRDAWRHAPNRSVLCELEPQLLNQWQTESIRQIIKELDPVTVVLRRDRDGRLTTWAWDQHGRERGWPGHPSQVVKPLFEHFDVKLLVGQGLLEEIPRIARALQKDSHPLVPWIDTRFLNTVIRLCGRQAPPLERNQPDAAIERTVLFRQIPALASVPEDLLRHWLPLAGRGTRQLLQRILQHRETLLGPHGAGSEATAISSSNRTHPIASNIPLERLGELLQGPSADERWLVLLPRLLLPLCAEGRSIDIVDPDGRYIVAPDIEWSDRPQDKTLGDRTSDWRMFASAYVQRSRDQHRSPHEACADGWIQALLQRAPRLRAEISKPYPQARSESTETENSAILVPADALRHHDPEGLLESRCFDRVVLVSPDTVSREITETEKMEVAPWWKNYLLPSGGERVVGLEARDTERMGVPSPDRMHAWLVKNQRDGWRLETGPEDISAFFKGLFPNASWSELTPRPSTYWIDMIDIDSVQDQLDEGDQLLTPLTAYRNAYLGQVAGFVAPLLHKKRVLLIASGPQTVEDLYAALLALGLYEPSRGDLTPMERIGDDHENLVIGNKRQLVSWALQAYVCGLKQPFDLVILEAWPIDAPEQVSPLSRHALREIRFGRPRQAGTPVEIDHALLLEGEEVSEVAEEGLIAEKSGGLFWGDIWKRRLTDNSHLLASYVWAAEWLSRERLLVLDSRVPPEMIKEAGPYTIHPKSLSFDDNVAAQVQDLVSQEQDGTEGPATRESIPEREEWNKWACNLFDLEGQLYEWQEQYLEVILPQKDKLVAVEEPTGSGKSLVFQLPALVHAASSNLLTLVVSPLKALMHEQCRSLWQLGFSFSVEAISGDLSAQEVDETYGRLIDGQIKLLFVAPERFRSRRFRQALDARLEQDGRLQYWVFDEAHCTSLWGHEFRPDYLYAAEEVQRLRMASEDTAPVVLLSATFPDGVLSELQDIFGTAAKRPKGARPILREEIDISVESVADREAKERRLLELLEEVNPQASRAVVFVTSRRLAEELAELVALRTNLTAGSFHAGLSEEARNKNYDQFRKGALTVLCATKAFGMGMDIDNIHLIVHFGPPSSLEDYLQEIGRGARSQRCLEEAGLNQARAHLLYEPSDFGRMRARLKDGFLSRSALQELHNLVISEWQKSSAPSRNPITIQLWDLAHRHSSIDTANQVRLGLYWLRQLHRIDIGYYTAAHVEVEIDSTNTEVSTKLSPESRSLLRYLREKAQGSRLAGLSARRAKEYLGLRTRNRLFALLTELARRDLAHFQRRLLLPLDEHRAQETRFAASTGSWPLLDAALRAIAMFHDDLLLDAEQRYSRKELERRFEDIAQTDLDPECYRWLIPGQRSDVARRDRHRFPHYIPTVLGLLRDLRIAAQTDRGLSDEGTTIVLEVHRNDWMEWFEAVPVLVRATLRNVVEQEQGGDEMVSGVGEVDGEELLLAVQKEVEAASQEADERNAQSLGISRPGATAGKHHEIPVSISHLEAVLRFLHSLGYLQRYDRYVPLALEVRVADASPIVLPEADQDAGVWTSFEEQKELRLLRLAALEAVPELTDQGTLRHFVQRYFEAGSAQELRLLLEESLSTNSQILSRLRAEAFEEFRENLSPEQKAVFRAPLDRHIMVLAGSGAGKTHTLLARLVHLVHDEDVRAEGILVLAFTRAVVTELRHRLRTLLGQLGYAALAQDVRVTTFHSFVMEKLREFNEIDSSVRLGDVDDWFLEFEKHLRENPTLRRHVADEYRYVFVDEFQDVHGARYRLLEYLAEGRETHLFAVGDDDQSIYDYERSQSSKDSIEYFHEFRHRFDPMEFPLTRNYRSARHIVDLSQEILAALPTRLKQEPLESNRSAHGLADWRETKDDALIPLIEEAQQALKTSSNRRSGHSTVAVLARTNADVYRVKAKLKRNNLHQGFSILVQGQESRLIDRRDIVEALDRLREDWGEQAVTRQQILSSLEKHLTDGPFVHWVQSPSSTKHELWHLAEDFFDEAGAGVTVTSIADYVREMSRDGNYIRVVARRQAQDEGGGHLLLSTIHKVKGVEFPAVILMNSSMRVADIDQELRTMYVGMTRAEDVLFVIRGEREERLLKREAFEPTSGRRSGIPVDPAFGDLQVSYFGAHPWRCRKIYKEIKQSDPLVLRRKNSDIMIYAGGHYIGKLARPGRKPNGKMNLAWHLNRDFPGIAAFDGLEVTGVYRHYVEQERQYDEEHGTNYFERLCETVKEQGFYYVVEIGGLVAPRR